MPLNDGQTSYVYIIREGQAGTLGRWRIGNFLWWDSHLVCFIHTHKMMLTRTHFPATGLTWDYTRNVNFRHELQKQKICKMDSVVESFLEERWEEKSVKEIWNFSWSRPHLVLIHPWQELYHILSLTIDNFPPAKYCHLLYTMSLSWRLWNGFLITCEWTENTTVCSKWFLIVNYCTLRTFLIMHKFIRVIILKVLEGHKYFGHG